MMDSLASCSRVMVLPSQSDRNLIVFVEHHAPWLNIGLGDGIAAEILLGNNHQIRCGVSGKVGNGSGAVEAGEIYIRKSGETAVTEGRKIVQKNIVAHQHSAVGVLLTYRMNTGVDGIQSGGNVLKEDFAAFVEDQ